MAKKLVLPDMALHQSAMPDYLTKEIRMKSLVKQVAVELLKPNPHNSTYFSEETPAYFRNLSEDIERRGIIVPLVSLPDNTLLAGHNRLRIAKELGFKTVPVQYVDDGDGEFMLNDEQIRHFVIKDNLLRRQLSSDEWIEKYRLLYPDFDEQILKNGAGKRDGLTATKIAHDTGQNPEAVKKQLQKHKATLTEKPKREHVPFGAKELRSAIERALAELQMKHYDDARKILEEVLR